MTSLFLEMDASHDDLGVVEHHQSPFGQIVRQMVEDIVAHYSMLIYE